MRKMNVMSLFLTLSALGGILPGYASEGLSNQVFVQQDGRCVGEVKDASGETIIGASVIVKGTTIGTVTDFNGNFALEDVKIGDVIQVSFVGYQTQEVKWNGKPLDIVLKEDTKTLDEVVVIGYGTVR